MLCTKSSASIEYDSLACGTLLCACHTVIGVVRGRLALCKTSHRCSTVCMLQVRAALDAAPFTGAEAVRLGLLDGLLYRTEAISTLRGLPVREAAAPEGAAAGECGAAR